MPSVLAVVAAEERDALVGGIGRLAHEQRRLLGVEPGQVRGNGLVRAARHRRVAGRDLDAIGGGRQDVARHDEQRRQRVPEVRGTEPEERDGADGERRERQAVAAHRHALDAAPAFNLLALVHRRLDELAHERRRVRRVGASAARFDGADDPRLQGRLVLFEVERDLLVARAAHQRPHEEVADQAHERDAQDDAEGDDGAWSEAPGLEPQGREHEDEEADPHDAEGAAQGQFHAPAAPHLADDLDQLGRGIPGPKLIAHKRRASPTTRLAPCPKPRRQNGRCHSFVTGGQGPVVAQGFRPAESRCLQAAQRLASDRRQR